MHFRFADFARALYALEEEDRHVHLIYLRRLHFMLSYCAAMLLRCYNYRQ